jgi:hypothetical protein
MLDIGKETYTSAHRVNRGGSWNNNASNLRSANRNNNSPGNRNNNLGFRVSALFACLNLLDYGLMNCTERDHVSITCTEFLATLLKERLDLVKECLWGLIW